MTTTLALDPGKQHLGYALVVNGVLTRCGTSKLPKEAAIWGLGKVAAFHYEAVGACSPDTVVVERMALTRARDKTLVRAIAVGNDLITLTSIAAFVAGRVGGELKYVNHPMVPKAVTEARVLHVLTPAEHDVLALYKGRKRDDLFDAVFHCLNFSRRFG